MTSRILSLFAVILFSGTVWLCRKLPLFKDSHFVTFLYGLLLVPCLKLVFSRIKRARVVEAQRAGSDSSVYGLDHGRLHLKLPLPMWMNMGYWSKVKRSDYEKLDKEPYTGAKTLAVASRTLLSEVLKTAGFQREISAENRRSKSLLDLGFGCGDQTVYLTSLVGIRESDKEWWDTQEFFPCLDSYTGITLDKKQYQYAQQRVEELQDFESTERQSGIPIPRSRRNKGRAAETARLFCADAAKPDDFDEDLKQHLILSAKQVDEPWVLALDTLYHFAPSRWPIIFFVSRTLKASFMGFDLCLADGVSFYNLILLRILTTLMGAPWANFVTQDQYREKLVEAGYRDITINDISEHVFSKLAMFLEEQDRTLQQIGLGLGPFHLARWMFKWWGQTGIIRGVVVVAKH